MVRRVEKRKEKNKCHIDRKAKERDTLRKEKVERDAGRGRGIKEGSVNCKKDKGRERE